jgi:hydroxymethylbilane synthase
VTRLRLGTRGSRLALSQSQWVAERLEAVAEGVTVELVEIRTSGDRFGDVPLTPELGRSFFTKEIEDALLAREIDLAVHSLKDLASVVPTGLRLAAIPQREDPRDALVSRAGGLAELPPGARVGTGSPRRIDFLSHARPDLTTVPQRGNVPTRVRAVDEGELDAIVLAAAGLRRLGMADRITELLDPETMMPAAGQGALAVQIRDDDEATAAIVVPLDHSPSRAEVAAERSCLRRLEAGCQAPVGVLARVSGSTLSVRAAAVAPAGVVRAEATAARFGLAEDAGASVADMLLSRLGVESFRELTWAGPPPRAV